MLATIPIEGNIVQASYIENTHILFCDAAFANKTPADYQQVLAQAERAARNIIIHNSYQ